MSYLRFTLTSSVSTLLVGCAFLSFTGSVHAALASFDTNGGLSNMGVPGPTQAGFEGLDDGSTVGMGSATQNGITLTMSITGAILDRDRGLTAAVMASPVPDVSRDFYGAEAGGSTTVDLSGLQANTPYNLRWHHYEGVHHNGPYLRLTLYRDDISIPANFLFVTGLYGDDTTNFFTDFQATTDGAGMLRLVTAPSFEGEGTIGYFNGFEVLSIAPSAHPGDFDGDGDVDGADFVAWQTHFPTASNATLADGDADGDGDVDGADFVVWQTNFPFTPASGVTSAPEPGSMILATIGGIIGLAWSRMRKGL